MEYANMEYIDEYMSDSALYVLEVLADIKELKEYSLIRYIIFNTRNEKEIMERMMNVIQIPIGIKESKEEVIRVDLITRRILNLLDILAWNRFERIIDYDKLINLIIEEWVKDEDKKTFDMMIVNTRYAEYWEDGKIRNPYMTIRVKNELWENFTYMCDRRKLKISEGFKLTLITFLEKRYEICRELTL